MKATIVGRHANVAAKPEFTLDVVTDDRPGKVRFRVDDANNPAFWMEIEFNMGDLLDTINAPLTTKLNSD